MSLHFNDYAIFFVYKLKITKKWQIPLIKRKERQKFALINNMLNIAFEKQKKIFIFPLTIFSLIWQQ